MKKIQTIVIGSVLVVGIVLSGMAVAGGSGDRSHSGWAKHRSHGDRGLELLTKYQYKNLMVQTLADITKQSAEDVSLKLKEKRVRGLLEDYGVDREAFRAAMRTNISAMIKQAAVNGSITTEQEKEILKKMEERAQRHAIMTRLIENGLAEGTITPEQAQMLKRRPSK
jgi:hypothetical protein